MKRSDLPRGADDSGAEPEVLVNPVVRWAIAAGDTAPLRYVDGVSGEPVALPYVGDVITHPRFVDPETNQPVPVRVLQIQRSWDPSVPRHTLAVVVTRDQPH